MLLVNANFLFVMYHHDHVDETHFISNNNKKRACVHRLNRNICFFVDLNTLKSKYKFQYLSISFSLIWIKYIPISTYVCVRIDQACSRIKSHSHAHHYRSRMMMMMIKRKTSFLDENRKKSILNRTHTHAHISFIDLWIKI